MIGSVGSPPASATSSTAAINSAKVPGLKLFGKLFDQLLFRFNLPLKLLDSSLILFDPVLVEEGWSSTPLAPVTALGR
jgi:hypothetical protein